MDIGDAISAATGRQQNIRGAGDWTMVEEGQLGPGTYQLPLTSAGAAALDAILSGTHTGTVPTARLYATQLDGVTQKGTAVDFPAYPGDGEDWTASIETLRGEQVTALELTVAAASTFTPTKGEYSCL